MRELMSPHVRRYTERFATVRAYMGFLAAVGGQMVLERAELLKSPAAVMTNMFSRRAGNGILLRHLVKVVHGRATLVDQASGRRVRHKHVVAMSRCTRFSGGRVSIVVRVRRSGPARVRRVSRMALIVRIGVHLGGTV